MCRYALVNGTPCGKRGPWRLCSCRLNRAAGGSAGTKPFQVNDTACSSLCIACIAGAVKIIVLIGPYSFEHTPPNFDLAIDEFL